LPFWLGMNKGWLSTLTLLSLIGAFWIGLAYLGWFLWAGFWISSIGTWAFDIANEDWAFDIASGN